MIYFVRQKYLYYRNRKRVVMSRVNRIIAAIEDLGEKKYNQLRNWFSQKDRQKWNRQIESDSESGKLGFLIDETLDDEAKGKIRDL